MLGDAERVEDRRVPLRRVLAGGRADRLRRNARHLLGVLRRIACDDLAHVGRGDVGVLRALHDQQLAADVLHEVDGRPLAITLRRLRRAAA